MNGHSEYLESLERESRDSDLQQYYLWPRTPINDIQSRIIQRVGVSDYRVDAPRSRPARIIEEIQTLREHNLIGPGFSVLDVACGDGIVLWQIRKIFADACCFGVDCNKGRIDTHEMIQRDGIRLYSVFIQHLFRKHAERPFDVVLMLNTYRGWESADLREHERDLPQQADAWFERNARYVILTATRSQIDRLRNLGFAVQDMGRGEGRSRMICATKSQLPQVPRWSALKRWVRWNLTTVR